MDWHYTLDRAIPDAPASAHDPLAVGRAVRRRRRFGAAIGSAVAVAVLTGGAVLLAPSGADSGELPAAADGGTPPASASPSTSVPSVVPSATPDDASGPIPLPGGEPVPTTDPAITRVLKQVEEPVGPGSHAKVVVAEDTVLFLTWKQSAFIDDIHTTSDYSGDAQIIAAFDTWVADLAAKVRTDPELMQRQLS